MTCLILKKLNFVAEYSPVSSYWDQSCRLWMMMQDWRQWCMVMMRLFHQLSTPNVELREWVPRTWSWANNWHYSTFSKLWITLSHYNQRSANPEWCHFILLNKQKLFHKIWIWPTFEKALWEESNKFKIEDIPLQLPKIILGNIFQNNFLMS